MVSSENLSYKDNQRKWKLMESFVIHFRVRMERTFILVFPNIHVIFMINRRTRFETPNTELPREC